MGKKIRRTESLKSLQDHVVGRIVVKIIWLWSIREFEGNPEGGVNIRINFGVEGEHADLTAKLLRASLYIYRISSC